eukprot:PhM_4_TR3026/c5_g2_i3/m.46463
MCPLCDEVRRRDVHARAAADGANEDAPDQAGRQLPLSWDEVAQEIPGWPAHRFVHHRLRDAVAGHLHKALQVDVSEALKRWVAFPSLVMYGQSDDIARRARQFSAGAFDALLNERRERPQRPRRDDLAAGHEVDDGLARLPLSTDAKAVPIAVAERVAALARSGALSRANAALSQAKIATGPAALTALRALHPHEPPPAVPAYSRAAPDVRARQTKRALRTFRLGSSAGPSGFTADAVKSLAARCPVRALVGSPLPEDARRFLFGARLVALHKKGGGVRPIGCNDFLRRLAAKVLCASAREDLRDHLLGERQVGVCVPGGVEAPPLVLHRRPRGLDRRNTVSRQAILAAVAASAPSLSRYAANAYDNAVLG